MDEATHRHLGIYESRMLDERHRRVTEDLFRWSVTHCTCDRGPGYHAKQAYITAAFDACCAPDGSTVSDSLVSAKCCLLFFLIDDGTIGQLDGFARFLETDASNAGDEPNESIACFTSLLPELRRRGRPVARWLDACRAWVAHTQEEQRFVVTELTFDDYLPYREHTIFFATYAECWAIVLGLAVPASAEQALRRSDLRGLAVRIIILANDLGSLDGDACPPADGTELVDINSVLLRARALGSRRAAVGEAVERHNHDVDEFHSRAHRLLREHGPEPQLVGQVQLLRSIVNGNLAATRHLVPERYTGGQAHLGDLRTIAETDVPVLRHDKGCSRHRAASAPESTVP